ncbi:uncharacterized protein LOC111284115 [Durio zibethinus]|uniref:Uncharacterized protein LOC111284115 n=1 Tax=Durio zibethinus TaxID=66656 RepID=A0A6P5XL27_DURZI|nr:uncharacterized protein LOC111284115 [Durio zibethinus]
MTCSHHESSLNSAPTTNGFGPRTSVPNPQSKSFLQGYGSILLTSLAYFAIKMGKTNLSHDGLNPAHVPYWWVNNPTLGEFCFTMIGRANIEGSKSNVAMNAWLPQASYPYGNFFDTSNFKSRRFKGSIGHAFAVRIHTRNQNQTSFYPFVPHEISILVELILGHLCYLLTDVSPQPNSSPDNVFHLDPPVKVDLGSKRRGRTPLPIHKVSKITLKVVVFQFHLGAPIYPTPLKSFRYESILPTSFAYIVPSTRGCSPWRPDAVMSTTRPE